MTAANDPLDLRAELARIDRELARNRTHDEAEVRRESRVIWWAAGLAAAGTAALILLDRAIAACGGT